jgi:hypothetical protein
MEKKEKGKRKKKGASVEAAGIVELVFPQVELQNDRVFQPWKSYTICSSARRKYGVHRYRLARADMDSFGYNCRNWYQDGVLNRSTQYFDHVHIQYIGPYII